MTVTPDALVERIFASAVATFDIAGDLPRRSAWLVPLPGR